AVGDEALAGVQLAALGLAQLAEGGLVLFVEPADDAALGRLGQEAGGPLARLAEHVADFEAALGAGDDPVSAGVVLLGVGVERPQEAHGAVTNDQLRRHEIPLTPVAGANR